MSTGSALPAGATSGERRRRVLQGFAPPAHVWDPDGPTGGAIAPALWDALRETVLSVQADWEQAIADASSPEEIIGYVAYIAAAVRAAAVGDALSLEEVPRTALSRRLLALIRTGFIARASALPHPPETSALLRILGALERVADCLEPDWAQHLADRLSGPDGLELVVEIAHDLRSPLTSILFLAETLQRARSGPVNPVQERQLGLIYSAAFGLSSVASDVIELARGGDRLVDLDPIPFSIADIFESVKDIVLPIAEEKGLTVRVSLPELEFRIGHPVALSRVLLNLTTNALKFTAEGFVEIAARQVGTTGRQGPPAGIEFSVRDSGRGIPPQSMATLYEPFRRRHKQGEYSFSGSGLGLSICRKLVEAMGSELAVETASDEGTRFHFVLPLPIAGQPR